LNYWLLLFVNYHLYLERKCNLCLTLLMQLLMYFFGQVSQSLRVVKVMKCWHYEHYVCFKISEDNSIRLHFKYFTRFVDTSIYQIYYTIAFVFLSDTPFRKWFSNIFFLRGCFYCQEKYYIWSLQKSKFSRL